MLVLEAAAPRLGKAEADSEGVDVCVLVCLAEVVPETDTVELRVGLESPVAPAV